MTLAPPVARPWDNTYWLPGGQVLCGEYPGDTNPAAAARKLDALKRFGVSTYIDLTTPNDKLLPYAPVALGFEVHHQPGDPLILEHIVPTREIHKFPIRDLSVPDAAWMSQILDTIDEAVARGRTVYLHCWGGVGRTGTVAGCWLRRHGAQGDEALDIIRTQWKTVEKYFRKSESPETDEQRRYVHDWSQRSHARRTFPIRQRERRMRGALMGGAVGGAVGALVAPLTRDQIQTLHGAQGVQHFVGSDSWPYGGITASTQLTLFTAEALIRCEARFVQKGFAGLVSVAFHAYQRWLHTQDHPRVPEVPYRGWLVDRTELRAARAPDPGCVGAIAAWHGSGDDDPSGLADAGAVVRAAPCGLFHDANPEWAFESATEIARITHGHPEGYVAAGVLAVLVSLLCNGVEMATAAKRALGVALLHRRKAPRTVRLLERAIRMADTGKKPSAAKVESLGTGGTAAEALAIAVYCARSAPNDFAEGMRLAVNHSGQSDVTGAICGSILGAALGVDQIPEQWTGRVEAREVIVQLADDLATGWREGDDWSHRYPPN